MQGSQPLRFRNFLLFLALLVVLSLAACGQAPPGEPAGEGTGAADRGPAPTETATPLAEHALGAVDAPVQIETYVDFL